MESAGGANNSANGSHGSNSNGTTIDNGLLFSATSHLNLDQKGFKELFDTQSLVDCTLACDGGKISAHKGVLAACSSYLAKILLEHPVEHPIIILPELNIEDVKTLVHYMYTGELLKSNTIHSTSLLRTAAILSVNSLNDLNNNTASNHYYFGADDTNINNTNNQQQQHTASISNFNSISNSFNSSITSNINSLNSSINSSNHHILNSNSISSSNNNSFNNNGSKSEFQFKCPVCQNDFQTICSFEYHMQRIHNVTSFGCEICHKPFVSLRYVLTDHMRRCHGWKAEQKLQC